MTDGAANLLAEIARLMELSGGNPFKARAFERAAETLGSHFDLVERAKSGTLTEIKGIGAGIADVLSEFLLHGRSSVRDELRASLPSGLEELARVPGLGPKKARQLIEELGVRGLRELEYACRENRIARLKGFGEKVQKKILEGVVFLGTTEGKQRLCDALASAELALRELTAAVNAGRHPAAGPLRVSEAGAFRRRLETLSELEFVVELPAGEKAARAVEEAAQGAVAKICETGTLPVRAIFAPTARFGFELARATATENHWRALGSPEAFDAPDEQAFYGALDLPEIPAEMRETGEEIALARAGKLPAILPWNGIQGVFHNHTTRSDGAASLEEMVVAAKKLGYRYIGISDHSRSAVYANGLKSPDLGDQEREVREVQEKHPEIRIFWGIESDILADGSLDYPPEELKRFDFVIASIHSRFQMDREQMTERILAAIRNPYTRFLGHATGRLLLGRAGYDLDMEKIIDEASLRNVAIEINANPARLDIDWRWGPRLREKGTRVSVNPDAHEVAGLEDTRYGVAMARKALIPSAQVVNAAGADEVAKWLARK